METSKPSVAALHEKAIDAARTKQQDKVRAEQLTKGALGAEGSRPSVTEVDGDAGLAGYVNKAKSKKKEQTFRGLSSQDVEHESDRSKKAVAAHMARAEAALHELRKAFEFTANYDDDHFRVTEELRSLSLEQYLHRSRQRFHAQKNKTLFQSNLETAERKHLFELDVDTMDPRDAHLPLPPTEEEIEQLGRELGLIKPAGGWKSRCDCDKKLEHIKQHVKLHERKLTKIKMLSAFFNQLDSVMLAVDNYRNDIAVIEEDRLREVLEAKQNQFTLMTTVQNQKQQLDRLKRRVKDVNETKAMEEEEREAEKQLSTMKEYLMNQTRNLGRGSGPGGGGGPSKHLMKQRLRRVMQFSANNEKRIMGSLDFDGHEDKQMMAFMEMQRAKSSAKSVQIQTMTDAEYFEIFGTYPTANIGFAKKQQAVYAVSMSAQPQSAIAPGAIAEMRRLATVTASPAFEDAEAHWTSETRLIESAVQNLAQQVAQAFEVVEAQRSRVQTTVVQLCKDNETVMEELSPLYAHAYNSIRDASKKLSTDVKLALKRISLAANDAVARAANDSVKVAKASWAQSSSSGAAPAPAGGSSVALKFSPTFAEYVAATEQAKANGGEKPVPPKAGGKKASGSKSPESTKDASGSGSKSPAPASAKKPSAKSASGKASGSKSSTKVSPPPALHDVSRDDDDHLLRSTADIHVEIPAMVSSVQSVTFEAGNHEGGDLTQFVHKLVFDSTVAQMTTEHAQKLRVFKDAFVRIAHRLSQCEVIDFGQGKVVDLELAQTPSEMLERVAELTAHVDDVVKNREPFVPSKVMEGVVKLHKACSTFTSALNTCGFRLPAAAVEFFAVPLTLGERVTAPALLKDITAWEFHLLNTSSRAKDILSKMCDADRRGLEDKCADVVESLQHFSSQANRSITHLFKSTTTQDIQGDREMPLELQINDLPLTTKSDIEASLQKVTAALNGQDAFLDHFSDVIAGELLELQEQNEDLKESNASLKSRLLIYEPETAEDGDDPWAGLSAFERQVVQDRDRLAKEVDLHRDQLRHLEHNARIHHTQEQLLKSELDMTRREIQAASENHKAALRARQAELLHRLLEAAEAEETLSRATIEEALQVAFVPIATAFASAFVKQSTKEPNPDAETQTVVVSCDDFECDTGELQPQHETVEQQTLEADRADRDTAMTVPPSPIHRSCGLSRRISFAEAAVLTSPGNENEPPQRRASCGLQTSFARPDSSLSSKADAEFGRHDEVGRRNSVGLQTSFVIQFTTPEQQQATEDDGQGRTAHPQEKRLSTTGSTSSAHTTPPVHARTTPRQTLVNNGASLHAETNRGSKHGSSSSADERLANTDTTVGKVTVSRGSSAVGLARHVERGTTPPPGPTTVSTHTIMTRPASQASTVLATPDVALFAKRSPPPSPALVEVTSTVARSETVDTAIQTEEVVILDSVPAADEAEPAEVSMFDAPSHAAPSSLEPDGDKEGMQRTAVVGSAAVRVVGNRRGALAKKPLLDGVSPDAVVAGKVQPSALPAVAATVSVGTWFWPEATNVATQTLPDEAAAVPRRASSDTEGTDHTNKHKTAGAPSSAASSLPESEHSNADAAGMPPVQASFSAPGRSHISNVVLPPNLARAHSGVSAAHTQLTTEAAPPVVMTSRVPNALLAAMEPIVLELTRHAPSAHGADLNTLQDLARYLTEEVAPVVKAIDQRFTAVQTAQRDDTSSGPSSALASRGPHTLTADSALRSAGGSRKSKRVTIDVVASGEGQEGRPSTTATPDARASSANAGAQPPPAVIPHNTDEAAQLASRLQGNFERLVTPADVQHRSSAGSEFPSPRKQTNMQHARQHHPHHVGGSHLHSPIPMSDKQHIGKTHLEPAPSPSSATEPVAPLHKPPRPEKVSSNPQQSSPFVHVASAAHHPPPEQHLAGQHGRDGEGAPLPSTEESFALPTNVPEERALSILATSGVTVSPAHGKGNLAGAFSEQIELVERPMLASASRSLRPNSRGIVDVERLLEVNSLLVQTLTELFKRLETKSKVTFEDPFDGAVEPPVPSAVIANMHSTLSSVFRLLHTDSRLARRSLTRALMQHAMKEKLSRFRQGRGEMIALAPQAAAFLDRQEEKMRIAVARLEAVKQQIAQERERMVKDFFLPVSDVPVAHIAAGLLPKRKTLMPPPMTTQQGALAKGTTVLAAAIQHRRGEVNDSPVALLTSQHLGRAKTPPEDVHRNESPTRGKTAISERPISKTPLPDLDPRWMVRPKAGPVVLGSLRAPAARRIVEPPGFVRQPGQAAFLPDRDLFSSPLQGRSATLSKRLE